MSRAFFHRVVVLGLAPLVLAACSSGSLGSGGGSGWGTVGPSGTAAETRSDQETRAACRARANEMYDKRDRAEIYAANPSVNSPQSANYVSGVTSRGLAGQFDYERTVNECARNAGTGVNSIISPSQVSAPPAPRSR